MFKKYMHLERYGSDEVQGIELGECYIFPKIDGTNGSLWWDGVNIKAGSRNRELELDNDNAGFYNWADKDGRVLDFFINNPDIRLYGEWLVPHSLKTYHRDAWRKFYIFDVQYKDDDRYLHYTEYEPLIKDFGLDYIVPISIIRGATYDHLLKELNNNTYLIEDGKGIGEGIVVKNYSYANKYGRTCWAKIVTNAFKEKNAREMVATEKKFGDLIEEKIVNDFLSSEIVDKVYAKIVNESEGWNSKYIPRLLNTVFHDFVKEELWDAVKTNKNPTINFKALNSLCIMKTKEFKPELF